MKTADELLPVITQERDQYKAERDQLRAKLAEYEKWSGVATAIENGLMSAVYNTLFYAECKGADKEELYQNLSELQNNITDALTSAYTVGGREERERCAKIAENISAQGLSGSMWQSKFSAVAAAIRSRTGGENE